MRTLAAALLGLVAYGVSTHAAQAAESYASCNNVVTSVPKNITTSGVWCVKQDLASASTTAAAINIAADNVTLDCNDFTVSGPGGAGDTSIGIHVRDRLNVTVRHCNVQGFRHGLQFQSTGAGGGHVVEDNSFNANTMTGIRVEGDGSVIRRNQVVAVGGTTTSTSAWGIYTVGSVNISDNTVAGVTALAGGGGSAYGIYTFRNPDGSVDGNRVRGLAKDGAGQDFGIFNATSGRIGIRNNNLFGDASANSTGLSCTNASGRAKDNIIDGFAIALGACGDGGGNDVTP